MKGSTVLLLALSVLFVNTNCSKDKLGTDNNGPGGNSTSRKAPEADAGPDIKLEIPKNWTPLGVKATDVDGTIESIEWRKVSGPVAHLLEVTSIVDSKVLWMEEGDFEFEVKVTDNDGLVGKDTVKITVFSNLRKLVVKRQEFEKQSNDLPGKLIAEEVYNNLKWVFCKYDQIYEQADDGPQPNIDYWLGGGSYFERLGNGIITYFGNDTLEEMVIYY